jgi:Tol biopolymer transport system component
MRRSTHRPLSRRPVDAPRRLTVAAMRVVLLLVAGIALAAAPATGKARTGATGSGPTADTGLIVFTRTYGARSRPSLFVTAPDGSGTHRLIAEAAQASASWDGRRIAFVRTSKQGNAIWIARADGSGARALTAPGFDSAPAWGQGSRTVFFSRASRDAFSASIYAIRDDGTGLRRVTTPGVRSTDYGNCDTAPSPSPLGGTVVYLRAGCRPAYSDIAVVYTTGTTARLPFRLPQNDNQRLFGKVAWSREGRAVAYSMGLDNTYGRPDGHTGIYVSSGTAPARLVVRERGEEDVATAPAWSADAAWLAFARTTGGPAHVWLARVDGSGSRQLTRGTAVDTDPAWIAAAH